MILLCLGIEAVLEISGLRGQVYQYAAFWPGLLQGWQPAFPGQALVMFLSYAVLHAGPLHVGMNMLTLWSLGREVIALVGIRRFWLLYLLSALAGALAYGLMAPGPQPMVGASGALFGLAGALIMWRLGFSGAARGRIGGGAGGVPGRGGAGRWSGVWSGLRGPAGRHALHALFQAIIYLVGINLVMWWAMDGRLAWQTHLGGGLAGIAFALLILPRSASAGDR